MTYVCTVKSRPLKMNTPRQASIYTQNFYVFVYQNDEMKVEKGKTFELGSIISLTMSINCSGTHLS